jgi:endonuclease G, mitochondrial
MRNFSKIMQMTLLATASFLAFSSANASVTSLAAEMLLHHMEDSNRSGSGKNQYHGPQSQVSDSNCAVNLYQGQAPTFSNTAYTNKTQLICYPSYALLASGVTRTGIWSAEYLTPQRIEEAEQTKRVNTFHPDPHLSYDMSAQLSDYVRSGYDRGHMSPSGDQPGSEAQNDSFSLANMAPQAPRFNRVTWAHLEESVRTLAHTDNLYVVTGLLFKGNQIGFLKGRVAIPTVYYKVVFDPRQNAASVFWGNNVDDTEIYSEPLVQFEQENGINFHMGNVNNLTLPRPSHESHFDGE